MTDTAADAESQVNVPVRQPSPGMKSPTITDQADPTRPHEGLRLVTVQMHPDGVDKWSSLSASILDRTIRKVVG